MERSITARLELNGQAFSDGIAAKFGEVESKAAFAATKINSAFQSGLASAPKGFEEQFKTSFRNIQNEAANLIKGADGKFSVDTSGIAAAAAAARERVEALRALDGALVKTTGLEANLDDATRASLAASRAAVASAQEEARVLTEREIRLNQVNAALGGSVVQQGRATVSAGQYRAGMQQLGFQINDVGASLGSGANLLTVFAQQGSQFIQSVQLMTGATSGFLGFLAGPWGAGLLAAGTLLATFALNHNKSGDAAESNKAKQKSFSDTISEQNRRLRENIQLQGEKNKSDFNQAQFTTKLIDAKIKNLEAEKNAPILVDTTKGLGSIFAASQAKQKQKKRNQDIDSELVQLRRDRFLAEENERITEIAIIDRQNAGRLDKATAATNAYEDSLTKLQNQRAKNEISASQYQKRELALTSAHNANIEAIQKQTRAEADLAAGKVKLKAVTEAEARSVLVGLGAKITDAGRTEEENRAVGGAKNSFHLINQAFDIGLTDKNGKRLTKQSIRAAYAAQGIQLKELLGPGDKGHDDHFHIAFSKKRGTAEQLATSQIAGLDRELAEADAAAKRVEQTLDRLARQFDPAEDAARDFADALADISAAESGGKITSETAAKLRVAASVEYYDQAKAAENALQSDILKNIEQAGEAAGENISKGLGQKLEAEKAAFEYKKGLDEEAAAREEKRIERLGQYFEAVFSGDIDSVWRRFEDRGLKAIGLFASKNFLKFAGKIGVSNDELKELGKAAELGAGISSIGRQIGFKTSTTGGSIGGALGKASGLPGGDIIGSIVGGLLGGALKKTKKGVATLGFDDGALGVGSTSGNSGSRISAAKGGINAVGDALNQIAAALGGTVTGAGSVSLGVRGKNFVVDTSGRGRTKGSGVLSFKDEEEAIRAALGDALRDGVIGAISEASKRILQSGQKFESALAKAELIEAIPRLLKSRLDPVGAALDELNRRWDKTIAALKEGGASTEQIADAQRLYTLELEETRASTRSASADLRAFLDQFKAGDASPFSLGTQRANAEAALNPFLEKINAGQSIDREAYLKAAQTVLDIDRQIEGGTAGYFARLQTITEATEKAIGTIDKVTSINAARDPFAELTARNTATSNDLLDQMSRQIQAGNALQADVRNLLERMAGGNGFIGSERSFAA